MCDVHDEDHDTNEYDSGPYCRHWADPDGCEERCRNCGHLCGEHSYVDCSVDDCECCAFEDDE